MILHVFFLLFSFFLNDLEYKGVIVDFVNWRGVNHLHIDASKTKELLIDFNRNAPQTTPVNIQGFDVEVLGEYKYLGVHVNDKLDLSTNTNVLYKKGTEEP